MLLVAPIGRSVGTEEKFGAAHRQMLAYGLVPDVLADRNTDGHALDDDRFGQRSWAEIALLIKDVVIGQLALEPHRRDLPIFRHHYRIVQPVAVLPDGGEDHHDIGAIRISRQLPRSVHSVLDELRLEQQIIGKVARQEQFGKHEDVRARSLGIRQCLPGQLQVPLKVPHLRVELGERDSELVGHDENA